MDKRWAAKHKTKITKHVKDARNLYERRKEKETPIDLLKDALKQLMHENMILENVRTDDYPEAMKVARQIQDRASEIEHQFYDFQKKLKQLQNKKN
jgi:predicted nuclease with TOPRIM domain